MTCLINFAQKQHKHRRGCYKYTLFHCPENLDPAGHAMPEGGGRVFRKCREASPTLITVLYFAHMYTNTNRVISDDERVNDEAKDKKK